MLGGVGEREKKKRTIRNKDKVIRETYKDHTRTPWAATNITLNRSACAEHVQRERGARERCAIFIYVILVGAFAPSWVYVYHRMGYEDHGRSAQELDRSLRCAP